MNKKIGLVAITLLTFALVGCAKPAADKGESQESPDQGNAPATTTTTETANGDQVGKTDYTNQAQLEAAVREIFTRAQSIEGIQYENVIAYQGVETVQKIWQAKGNMKIITAVGGTESVSLVTEDQMITYDAATKQGVAFANQPEATEGEMPAINKDNVGDLKFISEETLDGEPCIVVTDAAAGTGNAKFWLSKNYGIIMKSEVVDTSTNTTMTLTVKNLKTFKPDANFFEVPKDITITKM